MRPHDSGATEPCDRAATTNATPPSAAQTGTSTGRLAALDEPDDQHDDDVDDRAERPPRR